MARDGAGNALHSVSDYCQVITGASCTCAQSKVMLKLLGH